MSKNSAKIKSYSVKSVKNKKSLTGFTAIVLAAGEGKRMRSPIPKVLHKVNSKPMIYYVIKELCSLKKYVSKIVVVLGHQSAEVRRYLESEFKSIDFVLQKSMLGTADAVKSARIKTTTSDVLVLCADAPLITRKTLNKFISSYARKDLKCAVVSADIEEENQLGAIVRDEKGYIKAIQEKIGRKFNNTTEVNSGIYAFNKDLLFETLEKVKRNPKKKEYFLTDVIGLFYGQGHTIGSYVVSDSSEILGINRQKDLICADIIMRDRMVDSLIEKGVRITDPDTTYIEEGVKIGKNTTVLPFTFIEEGVKIGDNCRLGPFLRIRKGSRIKNNVEIGNFIEVNRSFVDDGVTAKHFGYLGDTFVGKDSNIGAGTVVANYDGKKKHKTNIGKNVFIGCDSVLVAPVNVGNKAVTGAGSVVTKNVKAGSVVVGVPAKIMKKTKKEG